MDDVFFKKYKALKENFNVDYKGYQLKYIMARDFIFFAYETNTYQLTKGFIKANLIGATDLQDFEHILSQKKVLFSRLNYVNRDYDMLTQSIREQLDHSILLEAQTKFKKHISIFNIFVSFVQLFIFTKLKKISLKDRFYFFLLLVQYKNTIDVWESYSFEVNTTKFVPFLSCFPMDSILCQYFRKRGIKSYGIQHGLHSSSSDFLTFIPYDVVNIENLQADYILGWGDYTREALIKEGKSEKQFLLAGNPKYSDVYKIKMKQPLLKSCVLCLSRDLYAEGNLKLLEIAKKMVQNGLIVHLKFHPRSDMKIYEATLNSFEYTILELGCSINESIAIVKPDFVIVYNSTVYYEYYMKGIVALRYGYNQNDIPFGLEDIFTTHTELSDLIHTFSKRNKEQLDIDVNAMISRFCSLGVNNYRKILN
jgi:hypothetical protein